MRISLPPFTGERRDTMVSPVDAPVLPSVCNRSRSEVIGELSDPCICAKQIHGRFPVTSMTRQRPFA